jgi:hypothetical protein
MPTELFGQHQLSGLIGFALRTIPGQDVAEDGDIKEMLDTAAWFSRCFFFPVTEVGAYGKIEIPASADNVTFGRVFLESQ